MTALTLAPVAIWDLPGNWLVALMILIVFLAFGIVLRIMASRYKKIPPNAAGSTPTTGIPPMTSVRTIA